VRLRLGIRHGFGKMLAAREESLSKSCRGRTRSGEWSHLWVRSKWKRAREIKER
jgi:hypothetical protein